MRWLVDGYNVIRRDPDLRSREAESLEAGRAALLGLVAGLARDSRDEFTVVFDGARRGGAAPPAGRVQVLFSRPPETADDVLARLARQHGQGAVLVTSDRAVRDRGHRAGCAVLHAEEFLAGAAARAASSGSEVLASEGREDDDDDRAERTGGVKRGNPRRLSKEARAARRALRRLRDR